MQNAAPPITAHLIWPVMKLPGRMPMPCRNQTVPTKTSNAPQIFIAIRIASSRSLCCLLRYGGLFQDATQNLAGRRPRNGVDDLPLPNGLVAGQFCREARRQILQVQGHAFSWDDIRLRYLARLKIWDADDRAVHDVRMFQQRGLELGWRDAERLALDHLFLAVNEERVAVLIDPTDVTR